MLRKTRSGLDFFFRQNWKIIAILTGLILFVAISQHFGLDKKVIVLLVILFGFLTQAFSILVSWIAVIPVIGPPVSHIISLPFFLIVNALAYLITLLTLRRGYTKDVVGSKILVTALLIGIIIGFVLGRLL
jgi:uncharacterized membrane protein